MLFQYIGDDVDSPRETTIYGYTFELNGMPVDVQEPAFISKLTGNPTFLIDGGVKPEPKPKKVKPVYGRTFDLPESK